MNSKCKFSRWLLSLVGLVIFGLAFAGCKGIATKGEKTARQQVQTVAKDFRPGGERPALPQLTSESGLSNYLAFAMLNQPRVEAAYFDWLGSVERITVERSMPDPKLTFEADIGDSVMTVMPGFMQMIPGPGKLRAAAGVATAESQAKYFQFENAVLQTAFALKRAYYNLHCLDDRIRINRQTLALLVDLEKSARAQNAAGKVTLQDVYRAQLEEDQLATEVANLEDSRPALMWQLRGALGLTRDQPDPPVPSVYQFTSLEFNAEDLLTSAFDRNPRLKSIEAEVRLAEASIAMAAKSKIPDFSLGLMADVKASPTMYRPQAEMTLPIWRDKIAAQIAQAQAGKRAAEARLTSEQITLTADFGMKTYDYSEVTRLLTLLRTRLIPKAGKSLEIARSSYLTGQSDFFNLMDAQRTLLNFQLSDVDAQLRREIVLAELSLLIAGVPPPGAPLLASPPDLSSSSTNRSSSTNSK